jgi:hypothetical protein
VLGRKWILLIILVMAALAGVTWSAPAGADPPTQAAEVEVLRSDLAGIDVRIRVPAYRVETITVDGQSYRRIQIPGYELSRVPGQPALPERGVLLGIPVGTQVKLSILHSDNQTAAGFRLAPATTLEALDDVTKQGPAEEFRASSLRSRLIEDARIYNSAMLYPVSPVEIADTGYLRDQRYVKVIVYPVQYAPTKGEIVYHNLIDVRLTFVGGPAVTAAHRPRPESEAFESLLRMAILNYDSAATWQVAPTPQSDRAFKGAASPATLLASPTSWKIAVDKDGIYRLTYSDLANAGVLEGNPDPRTFKVYAGTTEIPIYIAGESDGSFGNGDSLIFCGQKTRTKYTETNVYWLTVGGANGRRMVLRSGQPLLAPIVPSFRSTVHLEQNLTYWPWLPQREDHEHWFWNNTSPTGCPPSPSSRFYTFTLPHPITGPYTATVRADAVGRTAGAHRIQVKINNQVVGSATWSGLDEQTFSFAFPSSLLVGGVNSLTIVAPGNPDCSADQTYYDWFEIDYQRTFDVDGDNLTFTDTQPGARQYLLTGFTNSQIDLLDVTDPLSPTRMISGTVTGSGPFSLQFEDSPVGQRTYAASAALLSPVSMLRDTPSDLHATSNGADYIMISHADFITTVQPLADYRAGQGLRVRVVDVQDIYDEFTAGVMHPQAIRDFLAYAYAFWVPPAPSYVLLVGEGSFDPKHYLATSKPTYIPPYLLPVDPWLYQTAADNRFVTVSGSDDLPDMYLGRFPVGSQAQAQTMVNKVLAYEQTPPAGPWNKSTLWVTDDAPDPAGDFYALSDGVINGHVPASYTVERVYLGQNYPYENPSVVAKAAVIDAVSQGQLFVSYSGHAAYNVWAAERILQTTDVPSLANGEKLPVWLPMTCFTGSFHAPDSTAPAALDVELVRSAGRGAIASFSPTGLGVATGHDFLIKGFLDSIFKQHVRHLGPATQAAKLNLYGSGFNLELLNTFGVLGDPRMHLAIPCDLKWDVNQDDRVNHLDLQSAAIYYRQPASAPGAAPYDVNGDGIVDSRDFQEIAAHWGSFCP